MIKRKFKPMKAGSGFQIMGLIGLIIAILTWISGLVDGSIFGATGFICIYLSIIIMALGRILEKGDKDV